MEQAAVVLSDCHMVTEFPRNKVHTNITSQKLQCNTVIKNFVHQQLGPEKIKKETRVDIKISLIIHIYLSAAKHC